MCIQGAVRCGKNQSSSCQPSRAQETKDKRKGTIKDHVQIDGHGYQFKNYGEEISWTYQALLSFQKMRESGAGPRLPKLGKSGQIEDLKKEKYVKNIESLWKNSIKFTKYVK